MTVTEVGLLPLLDRSEDEMDGGVLTTGLPGPVCVNINVPPF